jgi:hypothetical protein
MLLPLLILTIYAEGNISEPDIDINASSNEPPVAEAILVDSKTSSVTTTNETPPATATAGTTTTKTYTVPAQGGTPNDGVPLAHPGVSGREPQRITCPYGGVDTVTRPQSQIDACTVVTAVLLLFVFWPVFWIPFVVPVSTKQALRQ